MRPVIHWIERSRQRGLARSTLAVALALFMTFAAASPSSAFDINDVGGYSADGVNIRTGPDTSYTSIGLGYSTQSTCLYYTVTGGYVNGNNNWGYHLNTTTGVGPGYSSILYLYWYAGSPC